MTTIRRNDTVQVVTGDYAAPTARRVLQVLPGGDKLVIEGINRVFKHVRRGHPKSPQGGRLQVEQPIDRSNVMLYCDACARGVRVGVRYTKDGRKERHCKSCGGAIGSAGPAKKLYQQG